MLLRLHYPVFLRRDPDIIRQGRSAASVTTSARNILQAPNYNQSYPVDSRPRLYHYETFVTNRG